MNFKKTSFYTKIVLIFVSLVLIFNIGLFTCYAKETSVDSKIITVNKTRENSISPRYFLIIDYVEVVNHGDGYYTLTIYPEGDFSYSFDGGQTWQKSNRATIHTEAKEVEVALRDSRTYTAYYTVDLPKYSEP